MEERLKTFLDHVSKDYCTKTEAMWPKTKRTVQNMVKITKILWLMLEEQEEFIIETGAKEEWAPAEIKRQAKDAVAFEIEKSLVDAGIFKEMKEL